MHALSMLLLPQKCVICKVTISIGTVYLETWSDMKSGLVLYSSESNQNNFHSSKICIKFSDQWMTGAIISQSSKFKTCFPSFLINKVEKEHNLVHTKHKTVGLLLSSALYHLFFTHLWSLLYKSSIVTGHTLWPVTL